MDPIRYETQKTSNIDRPVWIARLQVLLQALHVGDVQNFENYGVHTYIVSQPYMGSMIITKPRITHLPCFQMPATPLDDEGEEVVVLLFANLHRFRFLYASLKEL